MWYVNNATERRYVKCRKDNDGQENKPVEGLYDTFNIMGNNWDVRILRNLETIYSQLTLSVRVEQLCYKAVEQN